VKQDLQAPPEQPEQQALLAQLVLKVHKASRVLKEILVQLALLAQQVHRVLRVIQV
jgi:hypothetical protein